MIRGLKAKPSYPDSTLLVKLTILVLIIPGILWLILPRLRRRYRFVPIISVVGAIVLIACLIALSAIGPKSDYDDIKPRVFITRADGQKVAEGAMPFGWDGTCGYSWRVPDKIKINGSQEIFNVKVKFDTKQLYGKVTATRKFVIYKNQ